MTNVRPSKSARTKWVLVRSLAVGAGGVLVVAACSHSPRNGTALAHSSDTVTLAGFTQAAGQTVYASFFDVSANGFTGTIQATTSTTATVDDIGTSWYGYSKNITLPQQPKYWTGALSSHQLTISMFTADGPPSNSNANGLHTFDIGSNTDTCLQNHRAQGGIAMMNACQSFASPFVYITAPCGTFNQPCCPGNGVTALPRTCDSGLSCVGASSTAMGACRGTDGHTCTVNADCVTNKCQSGTCFGPRAIGATCSVDTDCVSGTTCKNGVCTLPCTPGAACTVPGKFGPCAAGTTVCGGATPTCQQNVQPQTEICDGIDNDCDGTKDNHISSVPSCTTHPPECNDRGQSWKVPGTNSCVNGQWVCTATRQVDYCNSCQSSSICGACATESHGCIQDKDCRPDFICGTDGQCRQSPNCPQIVDCWTMSERGSANSCLP